MLQPRLSATEYRGPRIEATSDSFKRVQLTQKWPEVPPELYTFSLVMDAATRNNNDASLNTINQAQQPQRRTQRASRACLSCRVRKVKCDVVTATPCSNCRWDGTECVVPRTRRSRFV